MKWLLMMKPKSKVSWTKNRISHCLPVLSASFMSENTGWICWTFLRKLAQLFDTFVYKNISILTSPIPNHMKYCNVFNSIEYATQQTQHKEICIWKKQKWCIKYFCKYSASFQHMLFCRLYHQLLATQLLSNSACF